MSDEVKINSAGGVSVLRDPLIHFLVLGLGLFLLFELVASDEAAYDSKVIDVDREALLTFVQYRSRAFQPQAAAARLDGMSEEEVERLVRDYVREEALHREALALGMDKNDYVIKRRMIQSIEFITDDFANVAVDVSDEPPDGDAFRARLQVSGPQAGPVLRLDGQDLLRTELHEPGALSHPARDELRGPIAATGPQPGH